MINLANIIFAVVMGGLMSLSITLVTTFVRIGLVDQFFSVWLEVWAVAYPVAIICILIYRPFSTRVTNALIKRIKNDK
jgi:branched-subunit amino acid ABC-type transport system permease component